MRDAAAIAEAKTQFGANSFLGNVSYTLGYFPKIEAPAIAPDHILKISVTNNLSVNHMIWNKDDADNSDLDSGSSYHFHRRRVTCILSHDISNQDHLFGPPTIELIKRMVNNNQTSVLNDIPEFHKDLVMGSLVNGTFCPIISCNPQLSKRPELLEEGTSKLTGISQQNLDKSFSRCITRASKTGEKLM